MHTLTDPRGHTSEYPVVLHYAKPPDLDTMAVTAGLRLTSRWNDWTRTPAHAHSHDPISIYTRP